MTDFSLRHGEAVALGVAVDTVYSALAHGLPGSDAERTLRCLAELGFSFDCPALDDVETLLAGMEEFRQHLGGRLTITLLRGVGQPIDVHDIDRRMMLVALERVADFGRSQQATAGLGSGGAARKCNPPPLRPKPR
jgi:3-dehydroquinate synthase